MTMKNIVDGLCNALYAEFGDGYEIYTERVEQGLQTPSFLVRCPSLFVSEESNNRQTRTIPVIVQYLPNTANAQEEMGGVMERLFCCVPKTTVNGMHLHLSDLSGTMTDDVLTVSVSVTAHFVEAGHSDFVSELSYNGHLKG